MAEQLQTEDFTTQHERDDDMDTHSNAKEGDGETASEAPRHPNSSDGNGYEVIETDEINKARTFCDDDQKMDFEEGCEKVNPDDCDPFKGVDIATLLSKAEVAEIYGQIIKKGTKQVFRTRLMLMGSEGEAKTHVKRSLTGKRFDPGDDAKSDGEREVDTIQATEQGWTPIRKEEVTKVLSDEYRRDLAAEFLKELYSYRVKQLNDMASHQRHEAHASEDTPPASTSYWPTKVESDINIGAEMIPFVEEEIDRIRQAGGIKGVGQRKKPMTFDLWDFPAHEIFNNTHQVFFTRRSVYLFVCDLSKDVGNHGEPDENMEGQQESKSKGDQKIPHDHLEDFVSSIVAHTRRCDQDKNLYAPVFIILTHPEGLAGKGELIGTTNEKIQLILREKPTGLNITPYPYGNDPHEVEKLHRFIFEVVSEDQQSRQEVPLRWTELETTLTERKYGHILRKLELKQLAAPRLAEDDFSDALRFLCDLGKLVLFDDLPEDNPLKNIVIMDPHWLINQIDKVVDIVKDKDQVERNARLSKGILDDEVIEKAWGGLTEQPARTILNFMVHYCVFFGHHPRPPYYYVPALLPTRDDLETEESLQRWPSNVFYCWPLNVAQFHQLSVLSMVMYVNQADTSYSQLILPYEEGHRAVVTYNETAQELKIHVQNTASGDQSRPSRPARRIVNKVFNNICRACQEIRQSPSYRGHGQQGTSAIVECAERGCNLRIPLPPLVRRLQDDLSPDQEHVRCDQRHQNSIADLRVMFGARRDITISIFTSAQESNVKGLFQFLTRLKIEKPLLRIRDVQFHPLPYNDLDDFKLSPSKPVDVMILCHSIYNRRFAITDVLDSLYNEFLPHCNRVLGKGRIALLVHDFQDTNDEEEGNRMKSFKSRQPTAFQTTGLACTCGHLGEEFSIKQSRQEDLIRFLEEASTWKEDMKSASHTFNFPDVNWKGKLSSIPGVGSFFSQESPVDRPEFVGGKKEGQFTGPSKESKNKRKGVGGTSYEKQGRFQDGEFNMASTSKQTEERVKESSKFTSMDVSYQKSQITPITVCSLSNKEQVQGLIQYLNLTLSGTKAKVKFHQLSDRDLYKREDCPLPAKGLQVLCHSVEERGCMITDGEGALYENYLRRCGHSIGKDRLAIIVHDFDNIQEKNSQYMDDLRDQQPTAFKLSSVVITCGALSTGVAMEAIGFKLLDVFLSQSDLTPGQIVQTAHGSVIQRSVAGSGQNQNHPAGAQTRNQPYYGTSVVPVTNTNRPVQGTYSTTPCAHPVSVIICTSAQEYNVKGLKHKLETLKVETPELIANVRLQDLPYNDLDGFRFTDVQPNDVMVLCHSITNRGFLITDVTNAIYNKYLHHCNKVFGKHRLAVVVHDFKDTSSSATGARMMSFRQRQPSTFQLAGMVITFEKLSLEATIPDMEWEKLVDFLQRAGREPPAVQKGTLLKTVLSGFDSVSNFFDSLDDKN